MNSCNDSTEPLYSSNLSQLPLELRLQILRYILPSRTYFIFRHPQALALTASPLQKPIFAVSNTGQYAWTALDRWKARRKSWLVLTHPKTPCPEDWAPLLYTNRQFKEDCYTILYGDNRFIFHIGNQTAYAVEQCVQSTPFQNPLLPDELEPGLVFPSTVIPYLRKVYLIVRACINDLALKSERMVTRRQQKVLFNHIDKIQAWVAEIARLFAPAKDLTTLELIVRHYKRMSEDQATRYYNNVPAGSPITSLHKWQAMHHLDDVKQSFALVKNEPFPHSEVFHPLRELRGIDKVQIEGLSADCAATLTSIMSSKTSKSWYETVSQLPSASSVEYVAQVDACTRPKRSVNGEVIVPQLQRRKKVRLA